MNKVVKEVIQTKTMYITVDGKEFEDYEAALNYELMFYVNSDYLRLMDQDGRAVALDEAYVVEFKSRGALEIFLLESEYEGLSVKGLTKDSSIGMYFWQDETWMSPQEYLDERKNEINETLIKCGGVPLE